MRWFLSIVLLFASVAARGAELPSQPMLRIETGMHTGQIRRLSADASGRWLVTSSDDKTARVWDLVTGQQVRVLRPPIGDGNEGKLYSVAMSPDGRYVAASGWTEAGGDKHGIYIFERATGALIRRIGGLPEVVDQLVYSPDGAKLVAGLGSGYGLFVFRASDGTELTKDTGYSDAIYGAHFDRSGRLVTTSWDGFIRLYDAEFKLVNKVEGPGGKQPYGVRFSPDGSKVAVGYVSTTHIDVFSATDLTFLYAPDMSNLNDHGDLSKMAWSSDGQQLFSGGTYGNPDSPVRRWLDGGQGAATDLRAADDTVMDLVTLQNRIVFGSADPAWGIIDNRGQRVRFVGPRKADLRDNDQGFKVSSDGQKVQFGFLSRGKDPAAFSLTDRTLTLDPAQDDTLAAPITASEGLEISGWKNQAEPTLNGTKLELKQYENARSLAIAPDGQSFALGADWRLRLFNTEGVEVWEQMVPGVVWEVNISGDGRFVIACYGDGTIRWHRMSDGQELLAFFPHADKHRWVMWTPSGYYDASPGGEDLIGWHVNHGPDKAADFFPASRFREKFYRPDIVSLVLETQDEAEAIQKAGEEGGRRANTTSLARMLPPVVTILSPNDGDGISDTTVRVKVGLRSPSGEPVKRVWALVDGRPAGDARGLVPVENEPPLKDGERIITVPVPAKDSTIAVLAETQFATSEPATVRLHWTATAAAPATNAPGALPKLYVLAVGVSKYKDPNFALGYPAKDAKDFVAALKAQKGKLYRDVDVKLLTDEDATKVNILDGLDWLQHQTTQRDVAMLFLAGHGVNDPSNSQFFYMPYEAKLPSFKATMVSDADVKTTLHSISGKVVAFLDACHSGNLSKEEKYRGTFDINGVINELSSAENGVIVFSSSTGRQLSQESERWKNGAFTKALIEGLSGQADTQHTGRVTVEMLSFYVSERVKALTGGQQTPATSHPSTVPDFPVAVSK